MPGVTAEFDHHPQVQGITVSLLQKWLACRQAAAYYLAGWMPVHLKDSLFFGSMAHGVLQTVYEHWRTHKRPLSEERFLDRSLDVANDYLSEEIAKVARSLKGKSAIEAALSGSVVLAMTLGPYLHKWQKDFTERTWLGVETQFDVQWKGIRLRGKRDGIYISKRGYLTILETKTRSRLEDEQDLTDALTFDLQSLFYIMASAIELGRPVRRVAYNIIRRPGLRQGKKEKPEDFAGRIEADIVKRPNHYFVRFYLTYPPEVIKAFEADLWKKVSEFQAWCEGSLPTYRNETACVRRFICPYLNICASGSTRLYMKGEIFRELQEE